MKTKRRWVTLVLWLVCQAIAIALLFPSSAYADDCLTDPLNAADCMRTPIFRPIISVIMSVGGTLVTILVNVLTGSVTTAVQAVAGAVPGAVAGVGPAIVPPSTPGPMPPMPPVDMPPVGPPVRQPPSVGPGVKSPGGAPVGQPPAPPAQEPGILETLENTYLSGTQSPGFDLIKNLTGPASTIVGSLTEWFTFPDSPQVLDSMRKAAQAWRANPTKATAQAYVKSVQQARDLKLGRAAGALDMASKVVDVVDAVGTGLDRANQRGYTGVDKALSVGAELGKKGLTWILTKNPIVGLTDAALGGATEMMWGKQGRIDIGSTIDRGANAWDNVTQEYFNNTQGATAQDAEGQMQDQFLHGLRRIRDQVNNGQLTREQGSARMRQLRNTMFGS